VERGAQIGVSPHYYSNSGQISLAEAREVGTRPASYSIPRQFTCILATIKFNIPQLDSISFLPDAQPAQHAIAASFDISGFSVFCKRHDAHASLSRYLSALFDDLAKMFQPGFRDYVPGFEGVTEVPKPTLAKFTGDGAILLWVRPSGLNFTPEMCTSIVAGMRAFQKQVPLCIQRWQSEWMLSNLPKTVRVGIATGPVQPLTTLDFFDSPKVIDYVGYCINLAVRLQDHCPEIGFLIHEPIQPKLSGLRKILAHGMKGALREPVYVIDKDFQRYKLENRRDSLLKFA
jgi:class 3 adenylate cyclase